MNSDEKAQEMMNIVMAIYSYAHDNNLDITDKDEVKEMLKIVKPEEAGTIDIEVLIQGLVMFDQQAKTTVAKKQKPVKN